MTHTHALMFMNPAFCHPAFPFNEYKGLLELSILTMGLLAARVTMATHEFLKLLSFVCCHLKTAQTQMLSGALQAGTAFMICVVRVQTAQRLLNQLLNKYTLTVALSHPQHRTCVPLLGQWSVTSGGIFSHSLVLLGNCSLLYVLMRDYCCNHEEFFLSLDFRGLRNGKGGGRFCESFCE